MLNRGQILWQIGRYKESHEAINAARAIAENPASGDKNLLAWTYLIKAQSDLSEQNYKSALAESRKAIELGGAQTGEIFVQATFIKGLANARSGNKQSAVELCRKAVEEAAKTGMTHLLLKSELALAEALLINNEPQEALNICLEMQNNSSNTENLFSQWRSFKIAAEASLKLNDNLKSKEFNISADQFLSKIENNLGAENYKNFISRPDVQSYRK
jgi:tetratricopeptide (TPR) repeat protein